MGSPDRVGDGEDGSSLTQRWGRADDGALVHITLLGLAGADQTASRWPPLGLQEVPPPAVEAEAALLIELRGSEARVDGEPAPGGWDRVESELALFAADRLDGLIAIHAAVLAWNDQVVLLPGPSRAGKSSLAVAAHRAGAGIWSDEYALLDPTGAVRGWSRPVRARTAAGSERLDLTVEHEPTRPSLVAVLRHDPPGDARWTELAPADAVMALMANCVSARTRPDVALDAALAVARSARALSGRRAEAGESVDRLFEILDELEA